MEMAAAVLSLIAEVTPGLNMNAPLLDACAVCCKAHAIRPFYTKAPGGRGIKSVRL
jgi:hypothetical protein